MDEAPKEFDNFNDALSTWLASEIKRKWQEELETYACVRCNVLPFKDGKGEFWCWLCGLHPKAEGPIKNQLNANLRGLDI